MWMKNREKDDQLDYEIRKRSDYQYLNETEFNENEKYLDVSRLGRKTQIFRIIYDLHIR